MMLNFSNILLDLTKYIFPLVHAVYCMLILYDIEH